VIPKKFDVCVKFAHRILKTSPHYVVKSRKVILYFRRPSYNWISSQSTIFFTSSPMRNCSSWLQNYLEYAAVTTKKRDMCSSHHQCTHPISLSANL